MIDYNGYHFCRDCSKNVLDFSSMDKVEILQHILRNAGDTLCANLNSTEINFSPNELISVINQELIHNKKTNYGFYLLLVAALSFNSVDLYSSENQKEITVIQNNVVRPPVNSNRNERFGEVVIEPNLSSEHFYSNAHKLPMYKGGIDKMYSFISHNLKYHKWEKNHKIEGRVTASFTVEKDESISDIKILRVPKNSKNLGAEATRIIKLMPKWIPAEHFNKKVRSNYVIPIVFKNKIRREFNLTY